jgi:hypothetical protein
MSTQASMAYQLEAQLPRISGNDFVRTTVAGVEVVPRQVIHATTTYDATGTPSTSYIDATTGANLNGTFDPDTELRAIGTPYNDPTFPLGLTLVGPVLQTKPGWNGFGSFSTYDFAAVPFLESITITAFETIPGLTGLTASQVQVQVFGETLCLNDGETKTWSIVRDRDSKLSSFVVTATGNAYAHIAYTGRV